MYVFGILVLLGVGAFALAGFADRYISMAHEFWAMTCVAFGIGLAWLAGFNLWSLWHLAVRANWIGVTLSGLAIGAVAFATYGAAHMLSAFTRKVIDEAASIEKDQGPQARGLTVRSMPSGVQRGRKVGHAGALSVPLRQ